MRYAKDTEVSADQTRSEIEKTLIRYGATSFLYGSEPGGAVIMFELMKRQVKFVLRLPNRSDFFKSPTGRARTAKMADEAYDKAVRQSWRVLLLRLKGRLESIEGGYETFEEAFLANIMLPDGSTVGNWIKPQLEEVRISGRMPRMIPQLTA